MIVERSTNLYSLLRSHWTRVLAAVLVVVTIEIANDHFDFNRAIFSLTYFGLMVAALSIFLVFRVNEAYSRWWEARTLWGAIVNSSRNFARQATTVLAPPDNDLAAADELREIRRELVYRQIAYVNALRLSLRRQNDWHELSDFLPQAEFDALSAVANKPNQLLQRQSERLAELHARGFVTELGRLMIDRSLTALLDAQGGCERIKNTAFPDRIAFFGQTVAWVLAIFVPVSVADSTNSFDVVELVVIPILMTAFLFTERLGSELKRPFENLPNDTPMMSICRTIEIDLRHQLGERLVPAPLQPVAGILM